MEKYQHGSWRGFIQGIALAVAVVALVAWLQVQFGPMIALAGLVTAAVVAIYQMGTTHGANISLGAIEHFVEALDVVAGMSTVRSKVALEEAKADRKLIEADVEVQKKQHLQALGLAKDWAGELANAQAEVLQRPPLYSQGQDLAPLQAEDGTGTEGVGISFVK